MRAAIVTKQADPVAPNIEFVTNLEPPEPGPGEVLIRTEASALNHLDLWVGRGMPGLDLEYPRVGGSDGCGIVEAVGNGVHEHWVGERVALNAAIHMPHQVGPNYVPPTQEEIVMIGEHTNGTHRELFTAPLMQVVKVGDADPVKVAAYALTHLTAYRMLVSRAQVRPGQIVLITGIGGGAAIAALNIAKHFGCETIVTTRHEWKLDRAYELGADHGILDEGSDWSGDVRRMTGKRGVDICVDSVGKVLHESCIKSLARGGTLVTCGCTTGHNPKTDLARIFWNQLSILGSTMGTMDEFRQSMALLDAQEMHLEPPHGIAPVVDQVFEAEDCRAAYERLESGEQFGKVVLKW